MPRIEPTPRAELPQHEATFRMVEAAMGFVPSSMAKVPGLMEAFANLAGTVSGMGKIDRGLGQLVANVASLAAGCRYCQAHTAAHAARAGAWQARSPAPFRLIHLVPLPPIVTCSVPADDGSRGNWTRPVRTSCTVTGGARRGRARRS